MSSSSFTSASSASGVETALVYEVSDYPPLHTWYEGVDGSVQECFPKYKWMFMVHAFANVYHILVRDCLNDIESLDRVGSRDNV